MIVPRVGRAKTVARTWIAVLSRNVASTGASAWIWSVAAAFL